MSGVRLMYSLQSDPDGHDERAQAALDNEREAFEKWLEHERLTDVICRHSAERAWFYKGNKN